MIEEAMKITEKEVISMSFTYRGLKAQMNRHIITDAEVDRQIQRLQQQNFNNTLQALIDDGTVAAIINKYIPSGN